MTVPPPPPPVHCLPYGTRLYAGAGVATVLADFDFEAYSEAGYVWDEAANAWGCLPGASQGKKGLPVVGAAAYAEHASTEVISLYYDLKDGRGARLWLPGCPPPVDLFDHLARGLLLEAWNVTFESWMWEKVCVPKYGWPPLPTAQLRCAMAKARAHALPGALGSAGKVLNLTLQKDPSGDRLLKKFSIPRNPTKANPARRLYLWNDRDDGPRLFAYNKRDIETEAEASSVTPDLSPLELELWQCDQAINRRGVQVDAASVQNCIAVIGQAMTKYNAELTALTGGLVKSASEIARLTVWLGMNGLPMMNGLDEDAVDAALARDDIPAPARRALELRQKIGSASIKKVFAMANQMTLAGRLHDLFTYHAARTGRAAGNGPQPQNLPAKGPDVLLCGCGRHCGMQYYHDADGCPWCGQAWETAPPTKQEWGAAVAEDVLYLLRWRDLALIEKFFGDALEVLAGCLRGLFVAAPGHDLICSDYSAIEGVVIAMLAGEEWRIDVFRTHGKIYEMSAAKITGIPFEEFMRYKKETGQHHPMRKKIGKVAELASGFGGWIGAWKNFGASEFLTDDEIKAGILGWRAASPTIVELWGGQFRGRPWESSYRQEYYGLEGMAISAVLNPGTEYSYRLISYVCKNDVLYCRLPSGRLITYHRPRLNASTRPHSPGLSLTYEGWNTNPLQGSVGWVRMETYGGKLAENVTQAVARDLLAWAMIQLERVGYKIVLHVHDEICVEVPEGTGSVEDVERIMGSLPEWAAGWPIKAAGGWRGKRYRKD